MKNSSFLVGYYCFVSTVTVLPLLGFVLNVDLKKKLKFRENVSFDFDFVFDFLVI